MWYFALSVVTVTVLYESFSNAEIWRIINIYIYY